MIGEDNRRTIEHGKRNNNGKCDIVCIAKELKIEKS